MRQVDRVLLKLRQKSHGITVHDFGIGFRLSAYILDLRELGYKIETIMEYFPDRKQRARYVLLWEPK